VADEWQVIMDPDEQALRAALRPVQHAPSLWRFNGCGTTMLGRYHDQRIAPRFYSVLFLTFLLVPIMPLGIYLVSTAGGGAYVFYAKISKRNFNAIYKRGYAKLMWNGMAETAFVFVAALLVITFLFGLALMFGRH
jgi:hypothetical protein